ncbi:nicotinamide N-methyltransferase-like [Phyllobates terribilis]|uniref:nicotinamide N-methyltransferase-like n=1 Tax=Phyllobates terribilis TaxID=111132 RepID=UPI003CCB6E15
MICASELQPAKRKSIIQGLVLKNLTSNLQRSQGQDNMATSSTSQQNYIDHFNPRAYLQRFYAEGNGVHIGDWATFAIQNLHETFTKSGVRGDTLLDVGTGASIYHLLSACEVFDKIIVSDLLESNHADFRKWLKKDPDAFDWNHLMKFGCELEGNGEDYEKKAEQLRSKVKDILKCDVLKRNPFDPVLLPPVDCLLTCLCLDVACEDIKSYCEVLKNFKDLIKPGGHLLMLGVLNGISYCVGEKRFNVATLVKEDLEMAFKKAGYQIKKAVYTPRIDKSKMHLTHYEAKYFIHARKPE